VGEVAATIAAADIVRVRVADLTCWLDAREAGLRLAAGLSHSTVLVPWTAEVSGALAVRGNLVPRVWSSLLLERSA
jgi:hypothetical protein